MANHPGKPGGQRTATLHPLPGEYSAVEPPDPIPNSEVKRSRADGSVHPHARVGHRQGLYPAKPQLNELGFCLCTGENLPQPMPAADLPPVAVLTCPTRNNSATA